MAGEYLSQSPNMHSALAIYLYLLEDDLPIYQELHRGFPGIISIAILMFPPIPMHNHAAYSNII